MTLGIVSRDSTLVFYQISDGLLLPQRPLNSAQREERDALRKMGKKGGPLLNEERRWIGDGAEGGAEGKRLRKEVTTECTENEVTTGNEETRENEVTAKNKTTSGNEKTDSNKETIDNFGDQDVDNGDEYEGDNKNIVGGDGPGSGGADWEEDIDGFWN